MLLNQCIGDVSVDICWPDNIAQSQVFPKCFFEDTEVSFLVLFFYPGDFTSICATEMLAFDAQASQFKELGAALVGCSTNGPHVHAAWKRTPKQEGGLGTEVSYPIIADVTRDLCKRFDVLLPQRNVATRGLFILDRNRSVLLEHRSDTKTARDVGEVLSILRELRKVTSMIPKRERVDSHF